MDYICDGMIVSVHNVSDCKEQQMYRILAYVKRLNRQMSKNKPVRNVNRKSFHIGTLLAGFWEKESGIEKNIYGKMKNWEERHPIMCIIICTILGGILISLVAGIILDVMVMMI